MTITRKRYNKLLSLLTALSILCSCFTAAAVSGYHVNAIEALDGFGENCLAKIVSREYPKNAEHPEEGYVWDATGFPKGHQFMYQMDFEFSGTGNVPSDTIYMFLKKHILKDKTNRYADLCEPAYPELGQETADDQYAYADIGDYIMIKNIKEVERSGAWGRVAYTTTRNNNLYEDMKMSDPFEVYMVMDEELRQGADELQEEYYSRLNEAADRLFSGNDNTYDPAFKRYLTAPPVCLNTTAELTETKILYPEGRLTSWPDDWGTEPFDASDYFYGLFVNSWGKSELKQKRRMEQAIAKKLSLVQR